MGRAKEWVRFTYSPDRRQATVAGTPPRSRDRISIAAGGRPWQGRSASAVAADVDRRIRSAIVAILRQHLRHLRLCLRMQRPKIRNPSSRMRRPNTARCECEPPPKSVRRCGHAGRCGSPPSASCRCRRRQVDGDFTVVTVLPLKTSCGRGQSRAQRGRARVARRCPATPAQNT